MNLEPCLSKSKNNELSQLLHGTSPLTKITKLHVMSYINELSVSIYRSGMHTENKNKPHNIEVILVSL